MAKIPYPPKRPLSVGEILDLTFQIYRATLIRCLVFSALGVLAGQLTDIYSLAKGQRMGGGWQGFLQALQGQQADPTYRILFLVQAILTIVFSAAVLLRQHALIADRAAGGEVAVGLRRTPAMIGLGILVFLSAVLCFLPALAVGGLTRYAVLLLMLIPASYVLVGLSCSYVVLLIEGAGPLASYVRSWRLTAGSFWRLSLIYTVGLIVLLVMIIVVSIVAGFLAGVIGRGDVVLTAAATTVTVIALGAITTPFQTAIVLAAFGDLTARKEGADLEQRISATV
ncbi:MAG TPA: hypothetical protein VLV29_07130 [Steroidobacteraceae bacterium]|nr:hypothetical protein [Steroidobacteraceae bacterium]